MADAVKVFLAADLGASSGRVVAGLFNGSKLALEEVYRFDNGGVQVAGRMQWDLLNQWSHVHRGLRAGGKLYGGQVAKTYFFSTSGGRTSSAQDAWGDPVPYLVSVPDPYDSISPYHNWGPFAFTGAKLAHMLKLKGRVTDLQPELNSSGRSRLLDPSP